MAVRPQRAPLQRCAALLATLLLAGGGRAETPVFQHFGVAEGLPSESIYALAQDHDGELWVGSGDGLARFDGSEWQIYRHHPQQPDSLPANLVQALHVDSQNRLWIGLEGGGLVQLDDERERLRRWHPEQLGQADVWALTSGADGSVWVGGYGFGLLRIADSGSLLQRWQVADATGLRSDTVLALLIDPEQRLWIGSDRGLQRWQDGRFSNDVAADRDLGEQPVLALAWLRRQLWAATPGGVFVRRPDGFERIDKGPPEPAFALAADAHDGIWMGRGRGLEHHQGGRRQRYGEAAGWRFGLGPEAVFDLLRDHEDALWVATLGGGLYRLPSDWRRFRSWPLPARPTAATFAGDGRLWVADAAARLHRIDPLSGAREQLLEADPGWPDRQIGALLATADGGLWMGHRRGLSRYGADGRVQHLATAAGDAQAPLAGPSGALQAAPDGGFWRIVSGLALERFDAGGGLLRRWLAADGFDPADFEQLRLDPAGQLWLAGSFGVRRLRADGEVEAVPGLPVGERIFGLAIEAEQLWVSSRRGLQLYRWHAEAWQPQPLADLLAGVEVGGLAADRSGRLWAPSARGLWRIEPASGGVRGFGIDDGLPGQEFPSRPLAEDGQGRLLALLPQAVVLIDPALVAERPHRLLWRSQPVQLRRAGVAHSLPWVSPVPLRHDDRELQFQLRGISFSDPQRWNYRFRIDGFDGGWVEVGASGRRRVSALPPGDYRMQIEARGPEGGWQPLPGLELRVQPPWWATAGVRVAAMALLLLAAGLVWRLLRLRAERRAAAALAESQRRWALQASEQKSRFLATLAHEVRTPMTGLLGMSELLQASPLDAEQATRVAAIRHCGERLLRLVNEALDLARIEAGKLVLQPRPVELRALLQDCLPLLLPVAERKQLSLTLRCPEEPQTVLVDPDRLQQIVLNLAMNALKFTEHGGVALQLEATSEGAVCQVQIDVVDSGPGIDAGQQQRLFHPFEQTGDGRRQGGTGLGLAISRELSQALGAELTLHSQPGEGTRVSLRANWPRAALSAQQHPAAGAPPVASRGVLLVEDDPLAAAALAGLLGELGLQVQHVGHALAALGEAAAADLALVDLDLPGIDGLQLITMLRERWPQLRCVAITAGLERELSAAATAAGALALLQKPVSRDGLQRLLQTLAGGLADAA